MKREFLQRLGVRRNALVGVVVGVVVAVTWFYFGSYRARDVLPYPLPLYGLLAVVSGAVIAMFLTIVLTLMAWFRLARRREG